MESLVWSLCANHSLYGTISWVFRLFQIISWRRPRNVGRKVDETTSYWCCVKLIKDLYVPVWMSLWLWTVDLFRLYVCWRGHLVKTRSSSSVQQVVLWTVHFSGRALRKRGLLAANQKLTADENVGRKVRRSTIGRHIWGYWLCWRGRISRRITG